ncbi:hypothetical protein F5Y19DRAFT_461770 [Xylariaceae sp. FL1651]|nr:hypothetical protein F5Y19DRAFT_461770 [Xylariaceae sp. FL1651]
MDACIALTLMLVACKHAVDTAAATVVTKRRRPQKKHISPEIGSLYDLLHDYAGVSLYVLPICWTDLHAQLLGCRFVQLPPRNTPTPPSSPSRRRSLRTPQTVVSISRSLDVIMSLDGSKTAITKTRAMRSILSTFYPDHLAKPHYCADLDLRFGRRYYPKAVRCQALWNHADPNINTMSFDSATTWTASQSASHLMASMAVSTSNDSPMLAYVSRSHLDHVRKNCFRVMRGPKGAFNQPVHRLQVLRSKNLLPKNPDEDSYFVAIMIAMAQQSVYADIQSGTGFISRNVKVRVLTVSEEDNAFMVYTATVPRAFLSMFHEPDAAPTGDSQIRIEYAQVPVWPILGFKERLGKALGAEIVGNFYGVPIDTYEDEMAPVPESTSPKRRREALSEVFNASFSEDREADCPGGVFRKRQCVEEGRVGVVR